MVTLVREARGWSQSQLASAAGVSQGFLSKVEAGLQDLRADRLRAVADALECPPTLLLDSTPIRGAEVTCLHHRRRGSRINATSRKQVEATTRLVRVSMEGLLAGIDLDTDLSLPRPGSAAPPKEAAAALRGQWDLAPGPIPNLVSLLERAGVLIHVRPLGTAFQDALSSWPPDRQPLMVVNSGLPGDRQRFTIAHELGHMLLHVAPAEGQETEANEFAAEFLAPATQIASDLEGLTTRDFPRLVELKAKWGMSIAALIQRAADLAIITDRQFREFQVRLNRLGWKVVEPGTPPAEQPILIERVIQAHLSVAGVTMDDMAAAAQLTEPAFRRFYASAFDAPDERPRLKVSTNRD